MSKFFTSIPVDLDQVRAVLPPGVFVEAIRWNAEKSRIEVYWDHAPFYTGRDFATEFALKELELHRLPEGTKLKEKRGAENKAPRTPNASRSAVAPTTVRPVLKPITERPVRTLKAKAIATKRARGVKAKAA